MKRVITPMPDDLIAAADAEAERQDRSRSWIIRAALTEYLGKQARGDTAVVISGETVKTLHKKLARIDKQNARTSGREPAHTFRPQKSNALRCDDCGMPKGRHA